MTTLEVIENYTALGNVERSFRNMKTVTLEMRPVQHLPNMKQEQIIDLLAQVA